MGITPAKQFFDVFRNLVDCENQLAAARFDPVSAALPLPYAEATQLILTQGSTIVIQPFNTQDSNASLLKMYIIEKLLIALALTLLAACGTVSVRVQEPTNRTLR